MEQREGTYSACVFRPVMIIEVGEKRRFCSRSTVSPLLGYTNLLSHEPMQILLYSLIVGYANV